MPRRRQASQGPCCSFRHVALASLLGFQLCVLTYIWKRQHRSPGSDFSFQASLQTALSARRAQSMSAKPSPKEDHKSVLPQMVLPDSIYSDSAPIRAQQTGHFASAVDSTGSKVLPNRAQQTGSSNGFDSTGFKASLIQPQQAGVDSTGSNMLPNQDQLPARAVNGVEGLVLGMAMGITADALFMFLTSLLRVAHNCNIVIFVDQQPPADVFNTQVLPGIDRVSFEVRDISMALPSHWRSFHASNTRYWLYADYMETTKAALSYRFVQVSDVRDIVFQSDPFAKLRNGEGGVHAFLEEPEILVGKESWNAGWVRDCFGEEQLGRIARKTVTCSGYTIGTAVDMKQYLDRMTSEIGSRASCERNGVDQGVHNVLVHDSTLLQGMKPYMLHANSEGWVWTGGYVRKGSLMFDAENAVVNEAGTPYAVLHQYDRHQDLLAKLKDKFLQAKTNMLNDVVDCSGFDVRPGDVLRHDLEHLPVESQVECCKACLGDAQCRGFVFSHDRRHCWMKINVDDIRDTDFDLMVGVRKV